MRLWGGGVSTRPPVKPSPVTPSQSRAAARAGNTFGEHPYSLPRLLPPKVWALGTLPEWGGSHGFTRVLPGTTCSSDI